jgi:hypothetical protein
LAGGLNQYAYAPDAINRVDFLGLVRGKGLYSTAHRKMIQNGCDQIAKQQSATARCRITWSPGAPRLE